MYGFISDWVIPHISSLVYMYKFAHTYPFVHVCNLINLWGFINIDHEGRCCWNPTNVSLIDLPHFVCIRDIRTQRDKTNITLSYSIITKVSMAGETSSTTKAWPVTLISWLYKIYYVSRKIPSTHKAPVRYCPQQCLQYSEILPCELLKLLLPGSVSVTVLGV